MLTLTDIYVYPIKSLGGIRLTEAEVEMRGLKYDRRWLLVDENGRFLTQRTFAGMALLEVSLLEEGLSIRHRSRPEVAPLLVPYEGNQNNLIPVSIWDDICPAQLVSPAADAWFSAVLGRPVRLVRMPATTRRPVDPDIVPAGAVVSFADAYPFLVIGQAALDHLNGQLAEPVPMNRFRPNFVFSGGEPHAEDRWTNFWIGSVPFRGVKPCARCVVTTINQATATAGNEPLRTLARYRTWNKKVFFGMNVLGMAAGTVRVGDEVRAV